MHEDRIKCCNDTLQLQTHVVSLSIKEHALNIILCSAVVAGGHTVCEEVWFCVCEALSWYGVTSCICAGWQFDLPLFQSVVASECCFHMKPDCENWRLIRFLPYNRRTSL